MKRLRQVLVCLGFVFLLLGMFGSIAKPVRAQAPLASPAAGENLEAQFVSYGPSTATLGEPTTLRVTWFIRPGPDKQPEDQFGATVSFYLDDSYIGSGKTDANGMAFLYYTFNDAGTHRLEFVISADSHAFSDGDTITPTSAQGYGISVEAAPGNPPKAVDQPPAQAPPAQTEPEMTGAQHIALDLLVHAGLHAIEVIGTAFAIPEIVLSFTVIAGVMFTAYTAAEYFGYGAKGGGGGTGPGDISDGTQDISQWLEPPEPPKTPTDVYNSKFEPVDPDKERRISDLREDLQNLSDELHEG